jgi:hypothetical protein
MVNHLVTLQHEFTIRVAEKERTRAEIRQMMVDCLREAERRLGYGEAREYWHHVARVKGVKPRGTTNKQRDERLLALYDEWIVHHPDKKSAAPGLIGDYLAHTFPRDFRSSAGSITRHLRRLLAKRKQKRSGTFNALAVLARTGEMPIGDPPWAADK